MKYVPLSNDDDVRRRHLRKYGTWRVLFLWEAGRMTRDQAADALGVSPGELDWVRAVALKDGPETPDGGVA